jgi:hypothetical protein
MQVRGLVQRQVESLRSVFEHGKKAGDASPGSAKLWGNSVVVVGCMVGPVSGLASQRGCVHIVNSKSHSTCSAS